MQIEGWSKKQHWRWMPANDSSGDRVMTKATGNLPHPEERRRLTHSDMGPPHVSTLQQVSHLARGPTGTGSASSRPAAKDK